MSKNNYVNGQWVSASGAKFTSSDPAKDIQIWQGRASTEADVAAAFFAAHDAFNGWAALPLEERLKPITRFKEIALARKSEMAKLIARETGKQLWDAAGEAGAVAGKVDISVKAYHDRTGTVARETAFGRAALQHRPHGVMAVLGPYNFPAHLPNGQILPSLIAGNTAVFKPSEQTPAVGQLLMEFYAEAGFPAGVINLVQGARDTGAVVPTGKKGDAIIDATLAFMDRITLGSWDEDAATMGPLISADIAGHVVKSANGLVASGATALKAAEITARGGAFVSPGLYDVTGVSVEDEEIFGPVLTVTRAADWDAAIEEANKS